MITGYKVDERCPESQDPGYFLIYGKLKVSFFTNYKRYITIIPGRKDEVYERITLWHCGTAREDT